MPRNEHDLRAIHGERHGCSDREGGALRKMGDEADFADAALRAEVGAEEGEVLDDGGAERERAAVAELLGTNGQRHGRAGGPSLRSAG